jgi:hypothetical protein
METLAHTKPYGQKYEAYNKVKNEHKLHITPPHVRDHLSAWGSHAARLHHVPVWTWWRPTVHNNLQFLTLVEHPPTICHHYRLHLHYLLLPTLKTSDFT